GGATLDEDGDGDAGGAIVMVRPSLLKLAITGMLLFTTNSADPLLSSKLADWIVLLLKVRSGDPGATTGSRLKVMRNLPGSVPIVGFTGEVKFITKLGGVELFTSAVK